MTDHEKSEYIYREMSRIGLNLDQLVSCGIDFDQSILSMPPEAKARYEEYLEGLSKKYSKKELRQKVLQSLLQKGYKMNDVLKVIERKKL